MNRVKGIIALSTLGSLIALVIACNGPRSYKPAGEPNTAATADGQGVLRLQDEATASVDFQLRSSDKLDISLNMDADILIDGEEDKEIEIRMEGVIKRNYKSNHHNDTSLNTFAGTLKHKDQNLIADAFCTGTLCDTLYVVIKAQKNNRVLAAFTFAKRISEYYNDFSRAEWNMTMGRTDNLTGIDQASDLVIDVYGELAF